MPGLLWHLCLSHLLQLKGPALLLHSPAYLISEGTRKGPRKAAKDPTGILKGSRWSCLGPSKASCACILRLGPPVGPKMQARSTLKDTGRSERVPPCPQIAPPKDSGSKMKLHLSLSFQMAPQDDPSLRITTHHGVIWSPTPRSPHAYLIAWQRNQYRSNLPNLLS